jgi:predicted  nucleic acid-binding Zn-ribbon protein
LRELTDQVLDQVQFFLVSEIKSESELSEKYGKLLHLLVDRISSLSGYSDARDVAQLYEEVHHFVPSAPSIRSQFMKWLPGQMQKYTELIRSFQFRIQACEQQLQEPASSSRETTRLKKSLEQSKQQQEQLKSTILQYEDELSVL